MFPTYKIVIIYTLYGSSRNMVGRLLPTVLCAAFTTLQAFLSAAVQLPHSDAGAEDALHHTVVEAPH